MRRGVCAGQGTSPRNFEKIRVRGLRRSGRVGLTPAAACPSRATVMFMTRSPRPRPAGLTGYAAACTVSARANTTSPLRVLAALPWVALMFLPYLARRALYVSTDRDGVVLLCRHRPGLDITLTLVIVYAALAPAAAALTALLIAAGPALAVSAAIVAALTVGFATWGVLPLLRGGGSLVGLAGPGTPPGPRYALMGLAQRPGTRYSALLLTRALLEHLPAGAVVVAAGASQAHVGAYQRLGFTSTRKGRIYAAMPRQHPS